MLANNAFHKDQSSCKACFNEKRRFDRLVTDQDEEQWWAALQQEQPKEGEKALKAFSKHCKGNDARKHKFSILYHRRKLSKRSGHRRAGRYKKMWENEFIEEMAKVEHGNMPRPEAKRRCDEMAVDKENPKQR